MIKGHKETTAVAEGRTAREARQKGKQDGTKSSEKVHEKSASDIPNRTTDFVIASVLDENAEVTAETIVPSMDFVCNPSLYPNTSHLTTPTNNHALPFTIYKTSHTHTNTTCLT